MRLLAVVQLGSMTAGLVKARLCRTGAAGFTGERVRGRGHRREPSGRGKLPCGMGLIRQMRKRNGGQLGLLSPTCRRLWQAKIAESNVCVVQGESLTYVRCLFAPRTLTPWRRYRD